MKCESTPLNFINAKIILIKVCPYWAFQLVFTSYVDIDSPRNCCFEVQSSSLESVLLCIVGVQLCCRPQYFVYISQNQSRAFKFQEKAQSGLLLTASLVRRRTQVNSVNSELKIYTKVKLLMSKTQREDVSKILNSDRKSEAVCGCGERSRSLIFPFNKLLMFLSGCF